jgi:hypothetical protein
VLGDGFDGNPAFDLQQLRLSSNGDWLSLTLTIAGNIYDENGNCLIYFDVTDDEQGADWDVLRCRNRYILTIGWATAYPRASLDRIKKATLFIRVAFSDAGRFS